MSSYRIFLFFFFNDTATTEIYTLSLHDALPIWSRGSSSRTRRSWSTATRPTRRSRSSSRAPRRAGSSTPAASSATSRSEEHTSELQSRQYLVCRLLLEKKKKKISRFSILASIHL